MYTQGEEMKKDIRKRVYRRRLILNIADCIHEEIARLADHKGITITNYVLQAVAEQILKDKMYE